MKWFRSNIKTGSRLALLALALQLALSFGHFHAGAAKAAALTIQSAAAQPGATSALEAVDPSAELPASHKDSDQQTNDPCAICAVIALASSLLSATPPLLLLPPAVDHSYLTTDAERVHLNSAGVAFQPRAPPPPDID